MDTRYRYPSTTPYNGPILHPRDFLYGTTLPDPTKPVTRWNSNSASVKRPPAEMGANPSDAWNRKASALHRLLGGTLSVEFDPNLLHDLQHGLETALRAPDPSTAQAMSALSSDYQAVLRLGRHDAPERDRHDSITFKTAMFVFGPLSVMIDRRELWSTGHFPEIWKTASVTPAHGHGKADGSCGPDNGMEVKSTTELNVGALCSFVQRSRQMSQPIIFDLGHSGTIRARSREVPSAIEILMQQLLRESHAAGYIFHVVMLYEVAVVFKLVAPDRLAMSDLVYRQTGTYYNPQSAQQSMTIHSTFAALACVPPISSYDKARLIVSNEWLSSTSTDATAFSGSGHSNQAVGPSSGAQGHQPETSDSSFSDGAHFMNDLKISISRELDSDYHRARHILPRKLLSQVVLHQLAGPADGAHEGDSSDSGSSTASPPRLVTPRSQTFLDPILQLQALVGSGRLWDSYRLSRPGFIAKICCPDDYEDSSRDEVMQHIWRDVRVMLSESHTLPPILPRFYGMYHGSVKKAPLSPAYWWNVVVVIVEDVSHGGRQLRSWDEMSESDPRCIRSAYDHLHSKGIVHGDVEPRHIFRQKDGTIRLIDFDNATTREDHDYQPNLTEELWTLDYALHTPPDGVSDRGLGSA